MYRFLRTAFHSVFQIFTLLIIRNLINMEMEVYYIIVHDAMVDRHAWAAQNHIGVQWVGSLFLKVNSCYKGHDHL